MEFFWERPRAFKMDRKSPFALSLKSSITQKLVSFLGRYTDDILAEYIIVLVCNGKHQVQAREDLEAFLGEKSDHKDANITSLSSGGREKNLRSSRSKDVQAHGYANSDSSGKKGKHRHPSANDSTPVPPTNVELPEDTKRCAKPAASLNGVSSNKSKSSRQNTISSQTDGTDPSTHKPSRAGVSSAIAMKNEQSFQSLDNSKKIVDSKGHGVPSSRRELFSNGLQSSIIERSHTGQTSTAIASARSLPEETSKRPVQSNLPRVSVWDRLGKPCEEDLPARDTTTDAEDKRLFDQNSLVNVLPDDWKKMEHSGNKISKLHAASNIARKRHFGEMTSGPSFSSVSMVGRNAMDQQCKDGPRDFKRLNSTSEVAPPAQVTQVLTVKEKLHQMELEISKLRTKQLLVKKDGQLHALSGFGAAEYPKEDLESRTVFVTNVHFAATKEALSLHFAKCGMVLNVVILTDASSGQPKGSAYIVFAKKESVDKAVALSGTSFFSRTLKVLRKAEEAMFNSIVPQRFGKPPRPLFPQSNRNGVFDKPLHPSPHLQWRREPVPTAPQPSATSSQDKKPVSTASQSSATSTQENKPVSTASKDEKPISTASQPSAPSTQDEKPVSVASQPSVSSTQDEKIEDLAASEQ